MDSTTVGYLIAFASGLVVPLGLFIFQRVSRRFSDIDEAHHKLSESLVLVAESTRNIAKDTSRIAVDQADLEDVVSQLQTATGVLQERVRQLDEYRDALRTPPFNDQRRADG